MANAAKAKARQYAAIMSNKNKVKSVVAAPKKKKVGKKINAVQLRRAFSDFVEKPSSARSHIADSARPRFVRVGK